MGPAFGPVTKKHIHFLIRSIGRAVSSIPPTDTRLAGEGSGIWEPEVKKRCGHERVSWAVRGADLRCHSGCRTSPGDLGGGGLSGVDVAAFTRKSCINKKGTRPEGTQYTAPVLYRCRIRAMSGSRADFSRHRGAWISGVSATPVALHILRSAGPHTRRGLNTTPVGPRTRLAILNRFYFLGT